MWNLISRRSQDRAAEQAAVSAALRAERAKTVAQIHDIEVQAARLSGSDALMMKHLEQTLAIAGRSRKGRQ
ncbi:hypothetical protein [Methylobacterium platani]|nr:hypothetical protein [Methylobacterium platani]